jgi:hypothetical protein
MEGPRVIPAVPMPRSGQPFSMHLLLALLFVDISNDSGSRPPSEFGIPSALPYVTALAISAKEILMPCLRLVLLSVACIWLSAGSLFAQSPGEMIGPLPFQLGPGHWTLLETLKPQLTEFLILPKGTPVSLEFLTFITTRTAKRNDQVEFRVVSDVSVEGLTVIPKDSVAWGTVTQAKKPGRFERDGKLQIALTAVILLNGQVIAIRIRPPAPTPAGSKTLRSPDSLQGPLLIPIGLAIAWLSREDPQTQVAVGSILKDAFTKGHHAELLPGTPVEAKVSQSLDLNREEFGKLQPPPSGRIP